MSNVAEDIRLIGSDCLVGVKHLRAELGLTEYKHEEGAKKERDWRFGRERVRRADVETFSEGARSRENSYFGRGIPTACTRSFVSMC